MHKLKVIMQKNLKDSWKEVGHIELDDEQYSMMLGVDDAIFNLVKEKDLGIGKYLVRLHDTVSIIVITGSDKYFGKSSVNISIIDGLMMLKEEGK